MITVKQLQLDEKKNLTFSPRYLPLMTITIIVGLWRRLIVETHK